MTLAYWADSELSIQDRKYALFIHLLRHHPLTSESSMQVPHWVVGRRFKDMTVTKPWS